jgi:hypothetical protein
VLLYNTLQGIQYKWGQQKYQSTCSVSTAMVAILSKFVYLNWRTFLEHYEY